MSASSSEEESMTKSAVATDQYNSSQSSDDDAETETSIDEKPKINAKLGAMPAISPNVKHLPKAAHPSYKKMVHEAVKELDGNARNGVTINSIIKFIISKYSQPESLVRTHCRKAIENGLKNATFVHKTGIGMRGSIKFSTEHKNGLKTKPRKATKTARVPKIKTTNEEQDVKPTKQKLVKKVTKAAAATKSVKQTKPKVIEDKPKAAEKKPTGQNKTTNKLPKTSSAIKPVVKSKPIAKPAKPAKPKTKLTSVEPKITAKVAPKPEKEKEKLAKAGPSARNRKIKSKSP